MKHLCQFTLANEKDQVGHGGLKLPFEIRMNLDIDAPKLFSSTELTFTQSEYSSVWNQPRERIVTLLRTGR